jgi:hypothetical protein
MEEFNVIEVLNWSDYQEKRKDIIHCSWFRLDHSLAFNPEWAHFDGDEKWVLVYLLSTASLKNKSLLQLSASAIAAGARVAIEKVHSAIQKLTEKGTIRCRYVDVPRLARPRAHRTDRTGQNKQDKQDTLNFDFESVWKEYPRRKQKAAAEERFARLIKTPEDFVQLQKAVKNYAAEMIAENTEPKFIKHLSSFLGTEKVQPWREWIHVEAPQSNYPDLSHIFTDPPETTQ